MQEEAQIISRYPLALPTEANFINAVVYELDPQRQYTATQMQCKVPRTLANSPNFVGVTSSNISDEFVIVIRDDITHKIRTDIFYCLKCEKILRGSCTNIQRHACTQKHTSHIHNLLTSEANQLCVAWFTQHHIAFNAISDPLFHMIAPNIVGIPQFTVFCRNAVAIIQKEIKEEIKKATLISVAADGWRIPDGRKIGIAFHIWHTADETQTYYAALRRAQAQTLGSKEISEIISTVLEEYEVNKEKVVALVSDSASDMKATADLLHLEWDRCVNHFISDIIENAIPLFPERFEKIHSIVSNLRKGARWIEFFNYVFKPANPEFSKYVNIKVSVPTRWGTRLEEALLVLKFRPAIEQFYAAEGTTIKPSQNLLPSDFDILKELKTPFKFIVTALTSLQSPSINNNVANVTL